MKAAFLTGRKEIIFEEVANPEIECETDVIVQVKCCGICGSDIHYFLEGRIGNQIVEDKIILGHEASGEVVETGSAVKTLKRGDKVAIEPGISCGNCEWCRTGKPNLCPYVEFLGTPPINGAFCEYLKMPEANFIKLSEGLGYDEGVLAEPLAIGVYGTLLSGFHVGQDVAILGVGPIGLSTLFSVSEGGAKRIFVSDLLEPRLQFAKKLGAEVTIIADRENVTETIIKATGGRGVDIAYEAAGQPEAMKQTTEIARIGGKSVIYGIPTDDRIELEAHLVRRKELQIINVRRASHTTELALEMLLKSKLPFNEIITHRFAFKDIARGLDLVAEYGDGVIKVLIDL